MNSAAVVPHLDLELRPSYLSLSYTTASEPLLVWEVLAISASHEVTWVLVQSESRLRGKFISSSVRAFQRAEIRSYSRAPLPRSRSYFILTFDQRFRFGSEPNQPEPSHCSHFARVSVSLSTVTLTSSSPPSLSPSHTGDRPAHKMSLARTINYIRKEGIKKFWRDLNYIGDAKSGRLVGVDR